MSVHSHPTSDIRTQLRELVRHLEHVLPAQAPIKDFVHHNTLHGYQHLHFTQALREASVLTGAAGYLPASRFRELYEDGRISREDLDASLRDQLGGEVDEPLLDLPGIAITKGDAYHTVFCHDLPRLSRSQLKWQVEELGGLSRLQPDLGEAARLRLLAEGDEATVVGDLWSACLDVLGLEHALLHPEELLDPSSEQVEALVASLSKEMGLPVDRVAEEGVANRILRKESMELLDALLARLGVEWTLRRLLLRLTGEDLLDEVRPYLIRHLGTHLDQGLAAWHNPERPQGFYAAWRQSAEKDLAWIVQDLTEWHQQLERLPDDPLDVVVNEMSLLGLPEDRWAGYLERLCLELPGWSGMALWRSEHANYPDAGGVRLDMMDYLAVFLVLERLFAQRICRQHWRIEASVSGIRWHFHHQPSELLVRHALFEGKLPEYLVSFTERLVREASLGEAESLDEEWQTVAHLIWSWRQTPAVDRRAGRGVADTAWPLFRLAQFLGMSGPELRQAGALGAEALLGCLSRFDMDQSGYIWLLAYERHYREQIFAALTANHGRGTWAVRRERPEAQLVFCMDDREEGIRRHLEEINPRLETLGAAAHFGVFQNWYGIDDTAPTVLCPVVARPAHEVREVPLPGAEPLLDKHRRLQGTRLKWRDRLHQNTRRGLLSAVAMTAVAAPMTLFALAGKSLLPARTGKLGDWLRAAHDKVVPTRMHYVAVNDSPPSDPDNPRLGFTDAEQAERVGNFLRNIGLTDGFASLVIIVGHGSNSLNNPHMAAYDCGACSGRHSGPNARLFAAMANRTGVRSLLAERAIVIPEDTWFLGCEHNTCDDEVLWYDTADLPQSLQPALKTLQKQLQEASVAHAQERCRRLASAPLSISRAGAWRHVHNRRWDYAQPRPELGHATNAWALIGRRSVTRGAFFDRRAFLISYDPTRDPEGKVLEGLLLANGPVGAGINLEYYFSTVDNERYGCGTKAVHNVAGFFGVMEGASSDLRTGLPRQMIEIHEAMRLLVVVEHKIDVITEIYKRQPPLQELIGGGWLLVAAKDPDSAALHFFDPGRGWIPWQGDGEAVPTVKQSLDWFRGHREPLSPALLKMPVEV
jgi:hypothetical protein